MNSRHRNRVFSRSACLGTRRDRTFTGGSSLLVAMTDLRSQLQSSLGSAYTIDRELEGGGMSRVFVADEIALDRRVVVKVVPPDIAGAVNVDRFKREIQLVARLQHAHIVPVLTAGESDGSP